MTFIVSPLCVELPYRPDSETERKFTRARAGQRHDAAREGGFPFSGPGNAALSADAAALAREKGSCRGAGGAVELRGPCSAAAADTGSRLDSFSADRGPGPGASEGWMLGETIVPRMITGRRGFCPPGDSILISPRADLPSSSACADGGSTCKCTSRPTLLPVIWMKSAAMGELKSYRKEG